MTRKLVVRAERFALREVFRISRGARTHADVLVVEIRDGGCVGRGECVPYARYGESLDGVRDQLLGAAASVGAGAERADVATLLPLGAARNALDCALWDLEARRTGRPVWTLCGRPRPRAVVTAYTLSLGDEASMLAAARANAHRPVLKVKVDRDAPLAKLRVICAVVPAARLIVDANEAWRAEDLAAWLPALRELDVALLEQPLPAGQDSLLADVPRVVPVAADESCHVARDVDGLRGRYDVVNVKLDKTGGLTEALATVRRAREVGMRVMVGCMVGTSLGIALAMIVAGDADFVDLDGPLLLAHDRADGITEAEGGRIVAPHGRLWGGGEI